MAINSINGASGINFLDPELSARPTTKTTLNIDDFLKLLTTQLSTQDPMKPMEDTQFISQMSSFTALEQTRDLNNSFKSFSSENLIGKMVDVLGPKGKVTGEVTAINIANGATKITVNGVDYDPAGVTRVTAKPVTTPAAQ